MALIICTKVLCREVFLVIIKIILVIIYQAILIEKCCLNWQRRMLSWMLIHRGQITIGIVMVLVELVILIFAFVYEMRALML